jgi:hypothetical protein
MREIAFVLCEDALTSDPQDVGLQCWSTTLDSSGKTAHAYALLRNNQSYNKFVERKLVDKNYGQVSITISDNEASSDEIATEVKWVAHRLVCVVFAEAFLKLCSMHDLKQQKSVKDIW